MKSNGLKIGLMIAAAGMTISCASPQRSKMQFYHGNVVPSDYIRLVRATAGEIEFQIRVEFKQGHLYHLVLDGDTPLAEGWFPTARLSTATGYSVVLKAKKGVQFVPGKTYRLCIGNQSADAVLVYSNNYRCLVDYEFTLPGK